MTTNSLTIAAPEPKADRDRVFGSAVANQEFRRPSIIRMYGHAFEWAGFGNYTKGLPQYQGGMLGANKFTYYGTSELGGRVYFTGFNEEGFAVSPRGVEDIQTGEVLAVEEINAPDIELDIPTFFDSLTTNTLTVNSELVINGTVSGSPNWGDTLPVSSTGQQGIIETATVAEAVAGTDTTRAVTPAGLQAQVNTLNTAIGAAGAPTGSIFWFCGAAAPAGYLICNGDNVPDSTTGTVQGQTADFTALHAVLGTTYGSAGDLPDLQGVFVRGWTNSDSGAYDEASNPDPSRTFGSRQDNAVEQHAHSLTQTDHTHQLFNQIGGGGSSVSGGGGSATSNPQSGGGQANITITDVTGADTNANESRPTNIALLPIIRI